MPNDSSPPWGSTFMDYLEFHSYITNPSFGQMELYMHHVLFITNKHQHVPSESTQIRNQNLVALG